VADFGKIEKLGKIQEEENGRQNHTLYRRRQEITPSVQLSATQTQTTFIHSTIKT